MNRDLLQLAKLYGIEPSYLDMTLFLEEVPCEGKQAWFVDGAFPKENGSYLITQVAQQRWTFQCHKWTPQTRASGGDP